MRRRDVLTPTAARDLAAIDAALAGRTADADTAELVALLVAERPRPRPAFGATLDAYAATGFSGARPRAARPGAHDAGAPGGEPPARVRAATRAARARHAARALGRRPLAPALATACVALVALVLALGGGDGSRGRLDGASVPSVSAPSALQRAPDAVAQPDAASGAGSAGSSGAEPAPADAAKQPPILDPQSLGARKVEQAASLELGAPADRIDDVVQGVLGVVSRFDGIVDRSSVASGAEAGSGAQFELRVPAGRLEPALAALSRLPRVRVLARADDAVDVNQAYVSIRRRLANARAERAGLLRALAAASTPQETVRLRARLDAIDGLLAATERSQRALSRRVDYSRLSLAIRTDVAPAHGASFTPGRALHDAGRLLAVTAGVVVIGAAALVPLAVLLACAWPLARGLRRRRREQALDAV